MGYYLLLYEVVDNFLERRAPFRQTHLELVLQAHARGELVMAGSFRDPSMVPYSSSELRIRPPPRDSPMLIRM